jgi:phosphonate transport system permease protein
MSRRAYSATREVCRSARTRGEIGVLINQSITLFQFGQTLTQILIVLALVIVVDNISAILRKRVT